MACSPEHGCMDDFLCHEQNWKWTDNWHRLKIKCTKKGIIFLPQNIEMSFSKVLRNFLANPEYFYKLLMFRQNEKENNNLK